jgi:CHASE3 domain sensor protein
MKLTGKRGLVLLMIMPVLLILQLGMAWNIFRNTKHLAKIEANYNKIDLYLRTNTKYISNGESAQRGYLLTSDKTFYKTYNLDFDEWKKNLDYYDTLPAEIKLQALVDIRNLSCKKFEEMGWTIRMYNSGDKDSSLNIVKTGYGKLLMDSIRSKSTLVRNKINADILAERTHEYTLIYAFFLGVIFLIVFSLFSTWMTYVALRSYTQTLENTVISLKESNERMSKYNYDSYHSLQTPLRNIVGFQQLLEKKYGLQLDTEARDYIHFITDGVKQLHTIIADMRHKYLESKEDRDV